MHWDFGWGMGWMMVWWWLFWIVLIAALVWALAKGAGRGSRQEESPEIILKRRYARGEMSREEYEQRLNDLRK